jgi:hypothetical protein
LIVDSTARWVRRAVLPLLCAPRGDKHLDDVHIAAPNLPASHNARQRSSMHKIIDAVKILFWRLQGEFKIHYAPCQFRSSAHSVAHRSRLANIEHGALTVTAFPLMVE